MTEASAALPSAVLLAAAGSKVYPGRLHVLMIDSSLAPCRDTYMRPENMEVGTRELVSGSGTYIYMLEVFHYTNSAP